jgi:hypothetical protein
MRKTLLLFAFCLPAMAANITTSEAKSHVGESATVCGTISGVHYAASTKGQPTFINLDGSCPHQALTIVIWGDHRQAFGDLHYTGEVCAKGKIELYHGEPEIVVDATENLFKK